MSNKIQIIAEVKTRSPFGYVATKTWGQLFDFAVTVGDIIAIHTDPRWDGSFNRLEQARRFTHKRILAKGFHSTNDDIQRAFDCGADYVLAVDWTPARLNNILVEPPSLVGLRMIPANRMVVWNSRDLGNGQLKRETFEEAREIFPGWLCQASNIKTVQDVHPRADAILVGTHLEEFIQSLAHSPMPS